MTAKTAAGGKAPQQTEAERLRNLPKSKQPAKPTPTGGVRKPHRFRPGTDKLKSNFTSLLIHIFQLHCAKFASLRNLLIF